MQSRLHRHPFGWGNTVKTSYWDEGPRKSQAPAQAEITRFVKQGQQGWAGTAAGTGHTGGLKCSSRTAQHSHDPQTTEDGQHHPIPPLLALTMRSLHRRRRREGSEPV